VGAAHIKTDGWRDDFRIGRHALRGVAACGASPSGTCFPGDP
jgi:hypothetical protein